MDKLQFAAESIIFSSKFDSSPLLRPTTIDNTSAAQIHHNNMFAGDYMSQSTFNILIL